MADIISLDVEKLRSILLPLVKKAEAAKEIATRAESYVEKRKIQLIGGDNVLYQKIIGHYTRAAGISKELIDQIKSAQSMQDVTLIYDQINKLSDDAAAIGAFYVHPIWYAQKYEIEPITRMINIIQLGDEIPSESAGLFDYSEYDEMIKFIQTTTINPFTICVIANLIKIIGSGDKYAALESIIEAQKDRVLGGAERVNVRDIIRCGRPITGFDSIQNILRNISTINNDEIIATLNTGFIIISRNMSYYSDMRGVFDQKYITANMLDIKEFAGVNKQIIKKFDTMHKIIPAEIIIPLKKGANIFGVADNYYILEESNGWFRRLSMGATKFDKNAAKNLMYGTTTRPQIYSRVQAEEIKVNYIDRGAILSRQKYEDTKLRTSAASIKAAIKDAIVEKMTSSKIKNFPMLVDFLKGKEPINLMLITMTKIVETQNPDIELSHLAEFYDICKAFSRELGAAIDRENKEMIKDLFDTELFYALRDICAVAVDRAMDTIDKQNLWARDQTYHEFYFRDRRIIM